MADIRYILKRTCEEFVKNYEAMKVATEFADESLDDQNMGGNYMRDGLGGFPQKNDKVRDRQYGKRECEEGLVNFYLDRDFPDESM